MKHKNIFRGTIKVLGFLLFIFLLKTVIDFISPLRSFEAVTQNAENIQLLDRNGKAMMFTYQSNWNNSDYLQLHEFPTILIEALVLSEDKRYFNHGGVDWLARGQALKQRIINNKTTRGASTITEQVVRMLHPRNRDYWSKWIEGIEAVALEQKYNKSEILEFYLNQVPYGSNRRGMVQAARFYFNRDLNTLNLKEMLALIVLIRAPSKYDLYSRRIQIDDAIIKLGNKLYNESIIDKQTLLSLRDYDLLLEEEEVPVHAYHFVNHLRKSISSTSNNNSKVITTISGAVQTYVHDLLEARLKSLKPRNVKNAAAIVIDNKTREVLAWVSVGQSCRESNNKAAGCMIDMVNTPRQPASSLKPFLYAAAIEKGWNADTLIDDSPYFGAIRRGTHHFHNYSNLHYGQVTLRAALGNSLNIPALHAINYVRPKKYLAKLKDLEFNSLTEDAEFYNEGLALGNGEATLYEVAQGYCALANRGVFSPLRISLNRPEYIATKRVYTEEVSSLISNILSDPWARNLEFGRNSGLNLPVQTAVKTGTSTDYRDAWALGYDSKYTVGIWMGNVDYAPMHGLTGSIGPSLVLRSIFNYLNLDDKSDPLYLSPSLKVKEVCFKDKDIQNQCRTYTEYYLPDRSSGNLQIDSESVQEFAILKPSNKLEMAVDPKVPIKYQAYEMKLQGIKKDDLVTWIIDGKEEKSENSSFFIWVLERGKHIVQAKINRDGSNYLTDKNEFYVK